MKNCEFSILIREKLLQAGFLEALEIDRDVDPSCFGNEVTIWKVGDLLLKFIKDRDQIFVDIGGISDKSHFYIYDDIAIMMEWQKLDEILRATEPLDLLSALTFIKRDIIKLEKLLSKERLKSTQKRLDEISEIKTHARFG